jgi:outer membrane biogenesis lipoprotein LolB
MTMITNTKIVLAAALLLGSASAVLANDVEVNVSGAQAERDWQEWMGQSTKHIGTGSYGYFSPRQHEDQSGRKGRTR